MHYDLIIRHAQLHRRQGLVDIAVQGWALRQDRK